jgi:hypothetical protein
LTKAYAERSRADLGELLARVDGLLAADRLLGRIEAWWRGAAVVQGIGRGEITKYAQFTRALAVVRSDLRLGHGFEAELAGFARLSDDHRRLIAGELALDLRQLTDAEAKLVDGGWKAVLAREKLLTAARRKIADRYVPECLPLLEQFMTMVDGVASIEGFAALERLYRWEVDTCVAKP